MPRRTPPPATSPATSDYGPEPFVTDMERAAARNRNYRTALWTGKHLQLTLMNIPAGGDVGLEVHPHTDQFLRIESGAGLVQMGPARELLNYQTKVSGGGGVFVPAGTWHNVQNLGSAPLKLYSVYAPPDHPRGTAEPVKPAE